ncbi:MAG TPA: hypothetical protein ENJ89_00165 [Caldithrix abyssi]|uniref:Outer membrane protein beta-barrel domain-containing protein n=1 Tax=Caldithrix abyssi TaxID=187145 RepID=A0A7V5UDX0_CALAY|nr:hypothetical protein [Caldithrix abyssi]
MKARIKTWRIVVFFILGLYVIPTQAITYSLETQVGYSGGPGIHLNAMLNNIAPSFPFKLRFGIGYTSIANPGKALDARKIFINNATNGRPEKQGWLWDFRFDLLRRAPWLKLPKAYFYAGVRRVLFTGNFNFVNGNEDFDIKSSHWGIGVGVTTSFAINRNFEIFADGGLDYFFPATLYGHDTSYSPDDENVNPREDFKYKDADNAINQPKFGLNLLMGLRYYF